MPDFQTISATIAKQWLDAGEAILIDVRGPLEFQSEFIPTAMNIPLKTLDTATLTSEINKDKKVIFQCLSGNRGRGLGQGLTHQP